MAHSRAIPSAGPVMVRLVERYDDPAAELLTKPYVAKTCKVTVVTVNNWIAAGRLPAYRLSSKLVRVRRGDLDTFLSTRYVKNSAS